MIRVAAPALLGLLVVSLLVPLGAPQESGAVGVHDAPWWDDDQNVGVDRFREGWNLRIPLEVHDPDGRKEGAPVQVHLDLARSLIEGGWPERAGRPASFTANPESVRLVEYDGWGQIKDEVAFRQHTTWLEPDQQDGHYENRQTGPFHGQRNAVVTLEWRLTQDLGPDEKHRFMVYFDIENNEGAHGEHRKPAPAFDAPDVERLDGLYWVGAGTTIYGHHERKTTGLPTLLVTATKDDTEVKVYTYNELRSGLDANAGDDPTFHLTTAGDTGSYWFGFQQDTVFRIEADRPVVVMTHNLDFSGTHTAMMPNFIPSRQGGMLGWDFDVPEAANGVHLIRPPGGQQGPSRVFFDQTGVSLAPGCSNQGDHVRLDNLVDNHGDPRVASCRITFNNAPSAAARSFSVMEGGDPIMIQYMSRGSASNHPAQVPSSLGSPVGREFLASTVSGQACGSGSPLGGGFDVTAWEDAVVDVVRRTSNVPLVAHDGAVVNVDPPGPVYLHGEGIPVRSCQPPILRDTDPYSLESVEGDDGKVGMIQARAGGFSDVQVTPFGGRHAMEFQLQGPFLVNSFYPETRIEVTHHESGDIESRTLAGRGEPRVFNFGTLSVASLTADKPVSVFPLGGPSSSGGSSSHFARFHAAKPDFLEPDILPGQYRGYLIETRSQDGTDPVFITGLPNQELVVPFTVRNHGQWNGDPLKDTVRFKATVESDSWDEVHLVSTMFDQNNMELVDHDQRNNRLTIGLPSDIPSETQLTITVEGRSEGNEQMAQRFNVIVLIRQTFDVEMWFGGPSSASGSKNEEIGIEEGSEREVPFVIRNEGSNVDTFTLDHANPGGGWDIRITDPGGQPLTRVEDLEPGTQTGAVLHLRAPATAEVPSVILPISAVSTTSPLASDLITLSADLDLERDVELSTAQRTRSIAPGATERFEITMKNTGESGLSLRMALDASLPSGWDLVFAGLGRPSDPPIALGPGEHAVVPVDITAPPDAAADDFVPFLLSAEHEGVGSDARAAISLAARVDRNHLLEISAVEELLLHPGTPTAFPVTITNKGNAPDEVRFEAVRLPGGWNVTAVDENHTLDPGESVTAWLNLTAPPHEAPGPVAVLLQARSGGPAFPFPVSTTVATVHELQWREPQTVLVQPGETAETSLRLQNTGNVVERVTLRATGPTAWDPRTGLSEIEIPPGSHRSVPVVWDIPAGEPLGNGSIQVTARTETGVTQQVTVPVRIETVRLELEDLVLTSAPARPGDVGTVIAILHNPGDVPVLATEVRLMGEPATPGEPGVVIERVTFDSVGSKGSVVAPLRWVEGEDAQVNNVVWGMVQDGAFLELGSAPLPETVGADPLERQGLPVLPAAVVVLFVMATVSWLRRSVNGDRYE